jgi:hypothetical protein
MPTDVVDQAKESIREIQCSSIVRHQSVVHRDCFLHEWPELLL